MEVLPNYESLLGVKLVIAFLVCLTVLEVVYLAFMKTFSNEIFALINTLVGTLIGVFFGSKA